MSQPYRVMPKTEQLPHALYRAAQVRALDRAAIEEFGIPGRELMARAGAAAFALLRDRWPAARDITVLTGTGNNGGDGFVVAELARQAGLAVRVLQLGDPERIHGDARVHAEAYVEAGGHWQAFANLPGRTDLVIDAMLGTGLERPLEGQWAAAVTAANASPAPVLALDIPSGLHADTGAVLGTAVQADATISFIGLKLGLCTGEGPACCGRLFYDALEVPAQLFARQIQAARRLDWRKQSQLLPPRRATAHKGDFGHVLVLGGDLGFGGAARLAAEAAARSGAGLTSLATRAEHVAACIASRPEIMALGVTEAAAVDGLLRRASVLAVGPGLGQGDWGRALWAKALDSGRPLVVDADALGLLAADPICREDWVLTPHPGEAARLLGCSTAEVQADRPAAVARLVQRYGGVAVLKGAGSLIAATGTRPPAVCSEGNPGMASGGMGDVLTGLIAGLMAQGHAPVDAAELAVCLHAAAGDRAAASGQRGLLAGDLFPQLRELLNPSRQ
jgi:NAD(P)H-hydrate epimerase